LSREIRVNPGADAVLVAEGHMAAIWPGAVEDPGMCRRSLRGNREISPLAGTACRSWSAPGRRGAVAGDARG
jgi:hypothetical protein